jgi:hypothetical protein
MKRMSTASNANEGWGTEPLTIQPTGKKVGLVDFIS